MVSIQQLSSYKTSMSQTSLAGVLPSPITTPLPTSSQPPLHLLPSFSSHSILNASSLPYLLKDGNLKQLTRVLGKEIGTYSLSESYVPTTESTVSSLFNLIEKMCSVSSTLKLNPSQSLYQDVQIQKAMEDLKIKLSESSDSGNLNQA
jgi:hypothetical protein